MTFCPIFSVFFCLTSNPAPSTSGEKRRNMTNCPHFGLLKWFTTFFDPSASTRKSFGIISDPSARGKGDSENI